MANYDYSCDACGEFHEDVFCLMSEVSDHVEKCTCGNTMRREFYAPQIAGDLPTIRGYDYFDENLGIHIHSKSQRDRELKKRGLEVLEFNNLEQKIDDERKYIQKHTQRKERRRAVNSMFSDTMVEYERAETRAMINKEIDNIAQHLPEMTDP